MFLKHSYIHHTKIIFFFCLVVWCYINKLFFLLLSIYFLFITERFTVMFHQHITNILISSWWLKKYKNFFLLGKVLIMSFLLWLFFFSVCYVALACDQFIIKYNFQTVISSNSFLYTFFPWNSLNSSTQQHQQQQSKNKTGQKLIYIRKTSIKEWSQKSQSFPQPSLLNKNLRFFFGLLLLLWLFCVCSTVERKKESKKNVMSES